MDIKHLLYFFVIGMGFWIIKATVHNGSSAGMYDYLLQWFITLQVLDLHNNEIKVLPTDIGNMTCLQVL